MVSGSLALLCFFLGFHREEAGQWPKLGTKSCRMGRFSRCDEYYCSKRVNNHMVCCMIYGLLSIPVFALVHSQSEISKQTCFMQEKICFLSRVQETLYLIPSVGPSVLQSFCWSICLCPVSLYIILIADVTQRFSKRPCIIYVLNRTICAQL